MPRMIYPERRHVTDEFVISWAHDLRVDATLDEMTENDETEVIVPQPTIEEALFELSDSGAATFARD